MPRIRTIKPDFWTDEKVVELDWVERLLFIALWNFVDDQGFIDYRPKKIKMQVFPGDEYDIEAGLKKLWDAHMVTLYEGPDGHVLKVLNWSKHQRVSNAGKPRFPPETLRKCASYEVLARPTEDSRGLPNFDPREEYLPPDKAEHQDQQETLASPLEPYPAEGKGKERKGNETASRDALASTSADPNSTPTQTLIAEWIDHCTTRPPGQVVGQISKHVKHLLEIDCIPYDQVRSGLIAWQTKGLHPSTLPSVVNEVINSKPVPRRQQETDGMFARALARAQERDQDQQKAIQP